MTQSAMILLAHHGSSDARWRAPFETLEQNCSLATASPSFSLSRS